MIEENREKVQQIRVALLMQRYQSMPAVKDSRLHRLGTSITFRFGLVANTELTNSGLYSTSWHGERNSGGSTHCARLSFETWWKLDAFDGGHSFWRWLANNFRRKEIFCVTEKVFSSWTAMMRSLEVEIELSGLSVLVTEARWDFFAREWLRNFLKLSFRESKLSLIRIWWWSQLFLLESFGEQVSCNFTDGEKLWIFKSR